MISTKDDCYTHSGKYCACIEFRLDEHRRHGFQTSQLIDYTLEPNLDGEDNKDVPPQKLAVAFSTADVVILGWQLERLADLLRENDLATVQIRPKAIGEIDRHKPIVASITIRPLKNIN
jgi:hypothetical protein